MTPTKLFPFFALAILIIIITALVPGCIPGWTDRHQVIDAGGTPVYAPPGDPAGTVQIPPTGNEQIDIAIGGIAAAIFGTFGWWIRRSNKNGQLRTQELFNDIQLLKAEQVKLAESFIKPMTPADIHRLRLAIAGVSDSETGPGDPRRDPEKENGR